jgi:hypothetical protein
MATPSASLGRQLVNPMFAAQAYLLIASIVDSAQLGETRSRVRVAARAIFFITARE